MREILNISIGHCGNQMAAKVFMKVEYSFSHPLSYFV